MKRDEAYKILTKHLKNKNLIKHSLAAEAAMKGIYKYLYKNNYNSEREEIWGITGLLHDVDYEIAMETNDMDHHGMLIFDKEPGIPTDIAAGIRAHNFHTGIEPQNNMEWAIRCVDQLTGLIVAAALIHPDKKLASITVEFIQNRMHSKSFAKGAQRGPILECEKELDIPLETFIAITLRAMKDIHTELGL